jgi:hypothetical protein
VKNDESSTTPHIHKPKPMRTIVFLDKIYDQAKRIEELLMENKKLKNNGP